MRFQLEQPNLVEVTVLDTLAVYASPGIKRTKITSPEAIVLAEDPPFDPRWLGASIRIDHWHFHRRLLERYGIVLGPADFSRMVRDVRKQRAPLLELRSNCATYLVRVPSTGALVFVIAKASGEMITVPPVNTRLLSLVRFLRKGLVR